MPVNFPSNELVRIIERLDRQNVVNDAYANGLPKAEQNTSELWLICNSHIKDLAKELRKLVDHGDGPADVRLSAASGETAEAFEKLLGYGTRFEDQGRAGTLFRLGDLQRFFLSDTDRDAIRSALAVAADPDVVPVSRRVAALGVKALLPTLYETMSQGGIRITSVNGKSWRLESVDGKWTMKPEGFITASEAKDICEQAHAGLAAVGVANAPYKAFVEYIFGKLPPETARMVPEQKLVPPWPLESMLGEMGLARETEIANLRRLLRRYRDETPLGHQPHMIAAEVDAALAEKEPTDV